MALFFASGMLSTGPLLQQLRVGALVSLAGPVAAWLLARVLCVGRYAPAAAGVVHEESRGKS